MADAVKTAVKRVPRAGEKRVMVSLTNEQYTKLETLAKTQMREPNNLLSFLLRGRIDDMIADETKV